MPDDWRVLVDRLTTSEASFAAMLEEDTPAEARKRRSIASAWAEPYHRLALQMRDAGASREDIRVNTLGMFLGDLRTEIAETASAAGMGQQQFAAWVRDGVDEAIETMPYVRTLREVLYHRLSNADDHWSGNDLADSQFLCCAAAYADFLAAENKFGDTRCGRRALVTIASRAMLQSGASAGRSLPPSCEPATSCARALTCG